MKLEIGDIVRYYSRGTKHRDGGTFPEGQPIVIEDLGAEDGIESYTARFVFNVTRFKILRTQTAPFDEKLSLEAAALEAILPIKGILAEIHHGEMLKAYVLLTGREVIPEIDEAKIVRAA